MPDEDLTPEQDKAIERIQICGVVALMIITVGAPLLDKALDWGTWPRPTVALLGGSMLLKMLVILAIGTTLVARIRGRAVR